MGIRFNCSNCNRHLLFRHVIRMQTCPVSVLSSPYIFINNYSDLWDKFAPGRQCLSSHHEAEMFWAHASLGIAIDLCLLAIPLWIVHSRMISSATSKQVMLVFSVGLFVILTGAIRLGGKSTHTYVQNGAN